MLLSRQVLGRFADQKARRYKSSNTRKYSMKKSFAAALVIASVAAASQAQAALVTWGISALAGTVTVNGTVTLDDTLVAGFYDGIVDPSDTHVNATVVLSSAQMGWSNVTFNLNFGEFQPYFYSNFGDGPHFDTTFTSNGWALDMLDSGYAQVDDGGNLQVGTWSLDRSMAVPEPTPLALLAAGLVVGLARRKAARA
jgi:hypothetical protein